MIEVLSTNYMYHISVVWVFFHILIKSVYIIHENLSQSLFKNVLTKLELTIFFINFGYSLIRLKLTNFALSDTCIYTYMNLSTCIHKMTSKETPTLKACLRVIAGTE